ncbi:MAG: hypothetical protein GY822_10920 [Deltaproteobacteria bacterium]|nr:hypothetical protein [Deltaproteobacteria bacterium]
MLLSFKTSLLVVLTASFAFFAPVASAQKALSLEKAKTPKLDEKAMEKDATNAVNTYYQSLIKGDYKKAGAFIHSDLIQGLRAETSSVIRQEQDGKKKKALLKVLGASSLAALENFSDAVFFQRWAASSFGFRIAVMANPKAEAKAEIEQAYCYPKKGYCDVAVLLKAINQGGKITNNRLLVRTQPEKGRWKVGAAPKSVKKLVPVNPPR